MHHLLLHLLWDLGYQWLQGDQEFLQLQLSQAVRVSQVDPKNKCHIIYLKGSKVPNLRLVRAVPGCLVVLAIQVVLEFLFDLVVLVDQEVLSFLLTRLVLQYPEHLGYLVVLKIHEDQENLELPGDK